MGLAEQSGVFIDPETEPAVRGRAMRESFEFLDEFQPGLQAQVRERMPAESQRLIDESLPTDWVAAPHTRALIDAVIEILGEEEAPTLWREMVCRKTLKSAMIRGLVEVISRIGGQTPKTLIKALPRGWNAAYRSFGIPRLERSAKGEATVVWESVPDYLFIHTQHWVAIRGVLLGLVQAGGEQGEVQLSLHPDGREVRAIVRW